MTAVSNPGLSAFDSTVEDGCSERQMISRGSEWHRWEPHIHGPDTLFNNQFGKDSWEQYIAGLENATPTIEAIAVTDYYVTDVYEAFLKYRSAGRLPYVQLVFPNIEVRLDIKAGSGFVNLHLLVSPEDADHVEQTKRFLSRLHFTAFNDRFACTHDDLIRLGRRVSAKRPLKDAAALRTGAMQFKVNLDQLREAFNASEWASNNILIAVAGSSGDGTSGLQEASDATLRQEIEAFADIIFASSPAQREFWLGLKPGTNAEDLRVRYGGCKPCLHGSDAHDHKTVGQPANNRFSWIKGGLEFDALRQACIDPAGRAYVGEDPPGSAMPSQVIEYVTLENAAWAGTPTMPLNRGLVAIIGGKGSGKTALADTIAAGCNAIPEATWEADGNISPSFLARARHLVGDAKVTLLWGDDIEETRFLDGRDADGSTSFPRARYLSQQFVEELCAAAGVSDGLVDEIERVIFQSHAEDDREGAIDFDELRDQKVTRYRQARTREAGAIADISNEIATELEKESQVDKLAKDVSEKRQLIARYTRDRAKLVIKGTTAQVERHNELGEAAQHRRGQIQKFGNQRRAFLGLKDEVHSMRATGAPEMLRRTQARHSNSGMDREQWDEFLMIYKDTVDDSLDGYVAWVDEQIAEITGSAPDAGDANTPLIDGDVELTELPLEMILAEMKRLEALFSAEKLVRDQYAALTERIGKETSGRETLQARLTDAQGAAGRRVNLQAERNETYGRVFEAILNEQDALAELYGPLMERLASALGTLKKLQFSVRRIADVETWGLFAEEELLDRRRTGPFNGRGSLIELATRTLKPAWEKGSAADVQAAMTAFIEKYLDGILSHARYGADQQAEHRAWLKKLAHWLFGTDHITVRYEISYDGIDIRKLSPGTRGIVLLLLYLALDDADDRPLIIDQPEENLDPKSVFDELVPLFIAAKERRQVIMVTHNANLVINTDADQVIVAEAGPHNDGGLPSISYTAGGLENAAIRKAVCNILEGGEAAFRERARRLRVRLDR